MCFSLYFMHRNINVKSWQFTSYYQIIPSLERGMFVQNRVHYYEMNWVRIPSFIQVTTVIERFTFGRIYRKHNF